jgi:hypothetical protein
VNELGFAQAGGEMEDGSVRSSRDGRRHYSELQRADRVTSSFRPRAHFTPSNMGHETGAGVSRIRRDRPGR